MFMFHVEHRVGDNMNKNKMMLALNEARKAYKLDEIPVGCVIFRENEIIACGYNKKESKSNAILHAEMIAIEKACKKLKSWRLDDCVMYVTLAPCMMCTGTIVESRINKVYYLCDRTNVCFKPEKYLNLEKINDESALKEYLCLLQLFFENMRN